MTAGRLLSGTFLALAGVAAAWLFAVDLAERQPGRDAAGLLAGDGVGPLRLGRSLATATEEARLLDPAAERAPCCNGRDSLSLTLSLDGTPRRALALADEAGIIDEVQLRPEGGTPDGDLRACLERLQALAEPYRQRWAPPQEPEVWQHAAYHELALPLGRLAAVGRWVPASGACSIALVYGGPDGQAPR